MRTCRFRRGGRERYGVVEGAGVRALTAEPWAGGIPEGPALDLGEVTLLAPVTPSKVVGVGHVERAPAAAAREPLLFLKPSTSVIGPGDAIRLPARSREVQHEAKLGIVIARTLTGAVTAVEARAAVLGFTCVNDVTARDIQRAEGHSTRAKAFDTFCPVGPVVETNVDPMDLLVLCRVNGEQRQRGATSQLALDPWLLVAFASQAMTLLPGDVVTTGTPEGAGPLRRGDWVEVEIPGIGVLKNPVT